MLNNNKQTNIQQIKAVQEKQDNLDLFKNYIVNTLYLDDSFLLEELNNRLIELIIEDQELRKSLENTLYVNQEKLTSKKFILDNKPHSPSVANWLKDFIKKNGSGMFDNLVLTEYLINSDNGKKLDSKEREMLKKLLLLYRNIKFFPESMPTDTGEGWEIIPVEKNSNPPSPLYQGGIAQVSEMDSLIKMAEQYPVGSLERKAVEEEMGKLGIGD